MTDEPFEACWYRWERADSHRRDMVQVWNDYMARDPHDIKLVHQGQGIHVIRVVENEPIPADFAGLFGEWLYNLRASLDYTIWAAAAYASGTLPPPGEGVLQYPIYDDEDTWKGNLRRIKGLPEHQQRRLRQMQPFASDPDANYLGWINRLARIDRHRTLVDGACYVAELRPVVVLDRGRKATLQWGTRVVRGPVTDVARVTIAPWDDDAVVKLNPQAGIDPEISQWSVSPFWGSKRFGDRVAVMQLFVAGEIAAYEYDCRGTSRRQDTLTDNFRHECDARGSCELPVRTPGPAEQWSAPVAPGTETTALECIEADLAGRRYASHLKPTRHPEVTAAAALLRLARYRDRARPVHARAALAALVLSAPPVQAARGPGTVKAASRSGCLTQRGLDYPDRVAELGQARSFAAISLEHRGNSFRGRNAPSSVRVIR